MKAVVMAGGKGTRMRPMVATGLNKHLVTLGNEPLICHVLRTLADGGVTDVLMIPNGPNPGMMLQAVGTGEQFGLHVVYRYEEAVSSDAARPFALAKQWVGPDPFVLMLGDAKFFVPLDFRNLYAPHMWVLPLDGLDTHAKYAQVELRGHTRVHAVFPKSKHLRSGWFQAGVWLLDKEVFEVTEELQSVAAGQPLFFDNIISALIERRLTTCTKLPSASFVDCGTPDGFWLAQTRVMIKANG